MSFQLTLFQNHLDVIGVVSDIEPVMNLQTAYGPRS